MVICLERSANDLHVGEGRRSHRLPGAGLGVTVFTVEDAFRVAPGITAKEVNRHNTRNVLLFVVTYS